MEAISLQITSEFSDGGVLYTNDVRYNPCVQLAANTSLTINRANPNPYPLPARSSLSIWFKREANAAITLQATNGRLLINSEGKLVLSNSPVVDSAASTTNLLTVDITADAATTDVMASVGEWHHLVWVKEDNQHTLYFNGVACETQTLENGPNPIKVTEIATASAAAYVVHFTAYERALEATEVVLDRFSKHNVVDSFSDQYPLNFTLKDRSIEGAPEMSDYKLIIEDFAGKERT